MCHVHNWGLPWCPMIPLKSELLIFWECRHDTSHYDGGLLMFLRHLSATKHLHGSVPPLHLPPAVVVCACCTVCCVYVAVRVFCLWFCSCHKVIKSMWHFYDIMTSRLKAERHPRRTKIIKQQKWSTPIAFVFTADSQQQQQQQHRETPWNMISNKKQITDDKNRVSPHAVSSFLFAVVLFFLISCEIEATEGAFKNSSRISLRIWWGR